MAKNNVKLATPDDDEPIDPRAWSPTPPQTSDQVQYKLTRTQVGKPQSWIILSTDWIGTSTHYWQGRTRKCDPEGCEACAALNQPRWHGFLAVWSPITHVVAILEVPKATVHQVNHHRVTLTPIRGMTITIERVPNKTNGTVHATLKPTTATIATLPPAPDVARVLDRMWDQSRAKSQRPRD